MKKKPIVISMGEPSGISSEILIKTWINRKRKKLLPFFVVDDKSKIEFVINLFKFITPSFLFGPFIALYVAWFFYLFRFYAMPYILGYDVWGMLAFPLESDFSRQLYQLFN